MMPVARLCSNGLVIFLFHGVIESSPYKVRNYTRKHLEKDYFARVMTGLKNCGYPVSMDQVIEHHREKKQLPPRAFAVTFDDGFENVLTVAAPILADLDTPATFYITTDFVDRNIMSWTDRIEWAVEQADEHGTVFLPWGKRALRDKRWFLDDVRSHVKTNRDWEPNEMASDIQRQLGFLETWSSADPLDRKLTWLQVKELASNPLFTIGGHSHTHPNLAFPTPKQSAHEIDISVMLLHREIGLSCRHYSYPEGLAHCYSGDVIEHLKQRGVVCCPTAEDGVNTHETDLFRLKRIMVV